MALTIYWSSNADKKFDKIIEYLELEWGETVTRAFVKRTYEFLDILADFPDVGSVENAERQIRAFVLVKQIKLFYKVKGDIIVLLNFYDYRQNPKMRLYSKSKH